MTTDNEVRTYAIWSGNPNGVPEDKTKCVQPVFVAGIWWSTQCRRKRGYGKNGEYCKQHGEVK